MRGFDTHIFVRSPRAFGMSLGVLYAIYEPARGEPKSDGRPRPENGTHIPMNPSSFAKARFAVGFPITEFFASFKADMVGYETVIFEKNTAARRGGRCRRPDGWRGRRRTCPQAPTPSPHTYARRPSPTWDRLGPTARDRRLGRVTRIAQRSSFLSSRCHLSCFRPPSIMADETAKSLRSATTGFDALFSNDLEKAQEVFKSGESPFHSLGAGVCAFLEAALGMEVCTAGLTCRR